MGAEMLGEKDKNSNGGGENGEGRNLVKAKGERKPPPPRPIAHPWERLRAGLPVGELGLLRAVCPGQGGVEQLFRGLRRIQTRWVAGRRQLLWSQVPVGQVVGHPMSEARARGACGVR